MWRKFEYEDWRGTWWAREDRFGASQHSELRTFDVDLDDVDAWCRDGVKTDGANAGIGVPPKDLPLPPELRQGGVVVREEAHLTLAVAHCTFVNCDLRQRVGGDIRAQECRVRRVRLERMHRRAAFRRQQRVLADMGADVEDDVAGMDDALEENRCF